MRGSRLKFLLAAMLLAAPTSLFAIDDREFKGEWAIDRVRERPETGGNETSGGRQGEGTAESATRSGTAPATQSQPAPEPAAPAKPESKPATEAKSAPEPSKQQPSEPKVLDTRTDGEIFLDTIKNPVCRALMRTPVGAAIVITLGSPSEAQ